MSKRKEPDENDDFFHEFVKDFEDEIKCSTKKYIDRGISFEFDTSEQKHYAFPDPGPIEHELEGLSIIEEILVARVQPVTCVFDLGGAKHGVNLTSFFKPIAHLNEAKMIPSCDAFNSIVLIDGGSKAVDLSRRELGYKVRSGKLLLALEWLRLNNSAYRSVNLNYDLINCLPHDGHVKDLEFLDVLQTTHHKEPLKSGCLPFIDDEKHSKVANIHEVKHQLSCAFPTLFPKGISGLGSDIGEIDSGRYIRKYFNYLVSYHDGRFAKNRRFIDFAFNLLNHFKIIKCSSSGYWLDIRTSLNRKIDLLGLPTFFFTLTAADLYWPDLMRILTGKSDAENRKLEFDERSKALLENPLAAAWFFKNRISVFMEKFLKPHLEVTDYWLRYEWQQRGSPHVHGLLWVKDAPDRSDIDSLSSHKRIVNFYSQHISASSEDIREPTSRYDPAVLRYTDLSDDEQRDDLMKCVERLQRHNLCTSKCEYFDKGEDRIKCRYETLELMNSLRKSEGVWWYIAKRNRKSVNHYNPRILQAWRSNTDLRAIITRSNNLTDYVTKGEPPYEKQNFRDKFVASSFEKFDQLCSSTRATRFVSVQEMIHHLMSWPLVLEHHESLGLRACDLNHTWTIQESLQEMAAGISALQNTSTDIFHMNQEQQEVLEILYSQMSNPLMREQIILVQGGIRTGKTNLIREMCKKISNMDAVQVLAHSSLAASNLQGLTVTKFLKEPSNRYKDLKFLIITECFMLTKEYYEAIDDFLRRVTGCSRLYGGLYVYLFGNIYSLSPKFSTIDDYLGYEFINNISLVVELKTVYVENPSYILSIASLVSKNMLPLGDTIQALNGRVKSELNPSEFGKFKDAIRIYPNRRDVERYNKERLELMCAFGKPVALIKAEYNFEDEKDAEEILKYHDLKSCIQISVGCRVMLKEDINFESRLVKGALGTVVDIVYRDCDSTPGTMPTAIRIRMDTSQHVHPLQPHTYKFRGVLVKQFPITLAYAITIHKARPLTFVKAVVDIGTKDFMTGLTYVALSRVNCIEDLVLERPISDVRLESNKEDCRFKKLEKFYDELITIANNRVYYG